LAISRLRLIEWRRGVCHGKGGEAEDEELTDVDWRTLRDTLRGSIAMFDMLLAECGDNSETARVVEAARPRREKVLEKIERRLRAT